MPVRGPMELDAWVLGIATIAAAVALAYATFNLYRATRSMDRRAALEERRKLLLRKIDLAAKVSAVTRGEFVDRIKGGGVPVAFRDILELAGNLEYAKDTVVDEQALKRVVLTLREANRGVVYPKAEEEWDVLHRVQEQLAGNLDRWYDELGTIAAQLSQSFDRLRRP